MGGSGGLACGIYCHARGGTRSKLEPEFPDPFLCWNLCRRANTSTWLSAHTPAPGVKEEKRERRKKKRAAVNNRIELNSWQGNDKSWGESTAFPQIGPLKLHCSVGGLQTRTSVYWRIAWRNQRRVAKASGRSAKLHHNQALPGEPHHSKTISTPDLLDCYSSPPNFHIPPIHTF